MSKLWNLRLRDEARRTDFWPSDSSAQIVPGALPEADAFARGLDEGRRTVQAEVAAEREALLQMLEACAALEAPSAGLLASLMLTAVERLVTDIAGQVPIDAALLRERAEALAAMISEESVPVLLIHPDDVGLIDAGRIAVPLETDATLARGTVQVCAGEARYEDGVQSALTRLRTRMAAMGIAA